MVGSTGHPFSSMIGKVDLESLAIATQFLHHAMMTVMLMRCHFLHKTQLGFCHHNSLQNILTLQRYRTASSPGFRCGTSNGPQFSLFQPGLERKRLSFCKL